MTGRKVTKRKSVSRNSLQDHRIRGELPPLRNARCKPAYDVYLLNSYRRARSEAVEWPATVDRSPEVLRVAEVCGITGARKFPAFDVEGATWNGCLIGCCTLRDTVSGVFTKSLLARSKEDAFFNSSPKTAPKRKSSGGRVSVVFFANRLRVGMICARRDNERR